MAVCLGVECVGLGQRLAPPYLGGLLGQLDRGCVMLVRRQLRSGDHAARRGGRP